MQQSKLESSIESTVNIATGFVISYLLWWALILHYGKANVPDPFILTSIFTVTSWLRSYYWRRFFATDVHKVVHRFVKEVWCAKFNCR